MVPKTCRQTCLNQHHPSLHQNCLISPLDHAIRLWNIWSRSLMMNAEPLACTCNLSGVGGVHALNCSHSTKMANPLNCFVCALGIGWIKMHQTRLQILDHKSLNLATNTDVVPRMRVDMVASDHPTPFVQRISVNHSATRFLPNLTSRTRRTI